MKAVVNHEVKRLIGVPIQIFLAEEELAPSQGPEINGGMTK